MRWDPHDGQKPRRLQLKAQLVVAAVVTAQPQEAAGQDAALREGV